MKAGGKNTPAKEAAAKRAGYKPPREYAWVVCNDGGIGPRPMTLISLLHSA